MLDSHWLKAPMPLKILDSHWLKAIRQTDGRGGQFGKKGGQNAGKKGANRAKFYHPI